MLSFRYYYRTAVVAAAVALIAPQAPAQGPAPLQTGGQPVSEVLARMGQAVGMLVVADSTLKEVVPAPMVPTTEQNLESQIADVVAALPPGTVWARVYLPEPPADRKWTGDSVAAYVRAQADLFGTVGGATAPGVIEVMGRQVPEEKAAAVVAALSLKPVYVVTHPNRLAASAATTRRAGPFGSVGTLGGAAQWGDMTPEQRTDFAKSAASDILNADPAIQRQMFDQQMSVMREVMTRMSPDQRRGLFEGIRNQMPRPQPGAAPTPGGTPNPEGGRRGGRRDRQ